MARSLLLLKYTQRRSQSPSSYVAVHFSVRTFILIPAGIYRCILYFLGCHCRTVGGDRCAFQLDTVLYLHRPNFFARCLRSIRALSKAPTCLCGRMSPSILFRYSSVTSFNVSSSLYILLPYVPCAHHMGLELSGRILLLRWWEGLL